jgi:hypothetical protein
MYSSKLVIFSILFAFFGSYHTTPQFDHPFEPKREISGGQEGGYGAFAQSGVNNPSFQGQRRPPEDFHQNGQPNQEFNNPLNQEPGRPGQVNGQTIPDGQDRSLGLILSGVSGAMRGVGRYVMGGGMMGGGYGGYGGYGVSPFYYPWVTIYVLFSIKLIEFIINSKIRFRSVLAWWVRRDDGRRISHDDGLMLRSGSDGSASILVQQDKTEHVA